jgi:hypothetical protein
MKSRNYFLSAALAALLAAPYAAQAFQATGNDATYHQKAKPKAPPPAPPVEPVSYPKSALARIDILPASISFAGPRYSQRLVVEGTFADGHQEELTTQAQITSSDGNIAAVDKDDFVQPRADGHTTIVATVEGQRANASVDV